LNPPLQHGDLNLQVEEVCTMTRPPQSCQKLLIGLSAIQNTEFDSVEQNEDVVHCSAVCIGIHKQVTDQKGINHSTTLAIPGLQEEQGRGHELNYPKQVSWNHCSGKGGEHFEEQLSVSTDKELGEIESVK